MIYRFATLADAITYGYRLPDPATDRDISGGSLTGFRWQEADGHKTVPVWLDESYNPDQQRGTIQAMFPPK